MNLKKVLVALVLCCVMIIISGCDNSSSPTSTVFNEPWTGYPESQIISDSSDSVDSTDGSDNSENSSENKVSKEELENFHKKIWLFGKKLSLPCRFEEFGENFSLGEEFFYQLGDDLIAFLCYNGNVIGEVILENCPENDPNKYAKRVIQLALGDAESNPVSTVGWHNNEIFFDVLGITMKSTPDEVEELLGKPTTSRKLSGNKTLVTYRVSDERFIEITYKEDIIVEFVVEVR